MAFSQYTFPLTVKDPSEPKDKQSIFKPGVGAGEVKTVL